MDISRYSRGKIYKLVNTVNDKIYVGSTCLSLTKRLSSHKAMAKSKPAPAHIHLNEIGWENIRIILVESVNAQNKDQLLQREQHYIDLLSPSLNKNSAYVNCPHGRRHNYCKDCGGSAICSHNKRKSTCKDCGGSAICSHNRIKSTCKECGGSAICSHNRIKSTCKECGGASICPHNKRKTTCRECGGASICSHNRIKSTCKECGGSAICSHNRIKSECKECGGSAICSHNKRKSQCKKCIGNKYFCSECELSFAGKGGLNVHLNSKKHRDNYNQMFEECFN